MRKQIQESEPDVPGNFHAKPLEIGNVQPYLGFTSRVDGLLLDVCRRCVPGCPGWKGRSPKGLSALSRYAWIRAGGRLLRNNNAGFLFSRSRLLPR